MCMMKVDQDQDCETLLFFYHHVLNLSPFTQPGRNGNVEP